MYTLSFIWILLLAPGSIKTNGTEILARCDGVFYRNKYYDKHILFESFGNPYNMYYDKFSGELLFSHAVGYGENLNFKITTCHVEKRICRRVDQVPGGYAIGYDMLNDIIYLGGEQGLYTYNIETNHVSYFAERGKSIWQIFIRRHFYYIEYPGQQLYVYKKGKFNLVPETIGIEVDNFFISRDFTVYFSNKTGLFKTRVSKRRNKPITLATTGEIRQIVEDLYGTVHFCSSDGVYIEHENQVSIKRVAAIDELYSIAFMDQFYLSDKSEVNQMIFSDKYAISVLLRSNKSALCSKVFKTRVSHTPVEIVKVVL